MKPANIEEYLEQAENLRQSIFSKMSAKEKLDLSFSLYRTAWNLKRAAIKSSYPELTDEQIENEVKEIFLLAKYLEYFRNGESSENLSVILPLLSGQNYIIKEKLLKKLVCNQNLYRELDQILINK